MKSLTGFLRTQYLNRKLEQDPVVVRTGVDDLEVAFAVHTWFEYHHRARDSYSAEPDMVEWLKKNLKPGEVFWDVGANVGAYSLFASKLCPEAKVIAFEPFIPTFGHLWENVVLNDCATRITPLCLGLSNETRIDRLGINDPRAGSSRHEVGGDEGGLSQAVMAMTADDAVKLLDLPAPTMLKIDTDGHEEQVLGGMRRILAGGAPRTVIVELEEGVSREPVTKIFESAGLRQKENPLATVEGDFCNALFERE